MSFAIMLFPLLILFLIIFSIFMSIKTSKKNKAAKKARVEEKEKMGYLETESFLHFSGLPLAEKTNCKVYYHPDKISIEGAGQVFNLSMEKVLDLAITTDVEIQKSYVSSVGGAVGGFVLFGPVGAMIGGRAKGKTDKTVTNFLIITYTKGEETAYIALQVVGAVTTASKMVQLFRQRPAAENKRTIDL